MTCVYVSIKVYNPAKVSIGLARWEIRKIIMYILVPNILYKRLYLKKSSSRSKYTQWIHSILVRWHISIFYFRSHRQQKWRCFCLNLRWTDSKLILIGYLLLSFCHGTLRNICLYLRFRVLYRPQYITVTLYKTITIMWHSKPRPRLTCNCTQPLAGCNMVKFLQLLREC